MSLPEGESNMKPINNIMKNVVKMQNTLAVSIELLVILISHANRKQT